ncbi:MAG: translation elongation factor Ts [Gemmataceae bacterium]
MSDIPAAAVKQLRDRTNLPFKDCKKALVEAEGDLEKAVDILRSKNKGVVDKRAGRETAKGRIAVFFDEDKKVGSIVEMQCESDPVATGEHFVEMSDEIAKHVAYSEAADLDALHTEPLHSDNSKTVKERVEELIGLIRENMKIARFERLKGPQGTYVHHNGSVGAAIVVEGEPDAALLRDIAMHVTATAPLAGTSDEIDQDIIAKEKEIAVEQTRNDPKMAGKPDEIIEKSVMGKLNKWLAQNSLLDQPFVKDESKKVGQLLKDAGLKYVKFIRFQVGELNQPSEEGEGDA